MKKLNLSFNKNIGDKGAFAIAECLGNIEEELDLCRCSISRKGVKEIKSKLAQLPDPVSLVLVFRY